MTVQFQFFQSLPHKKADFVKKKPAELGVVAKIPFLLAVSLESAWSADPMSDKQLHLLHAHSLEQVADIRYDIRCERCQIVIQQLQ